MGKPIVNYIPVFDADIGYTFTFSYNGNQYNRIRILILNSITNASIIDKTVDSMKNSYTITPSDYQTNKLLENGKSYTLQIAVGDAKEMSSMSDKVNFTCYSNPTVHFAELNESSENRISSGYYAAIINYSQKQNRKLKEYKFELYDNLKHLVESSDLVNYSGNAISYTYRNLENNFTYYLRFIGQTVDGVKIETGYVELYTSYIAPSFAAFKVKCNELGGYIQCSTNIISIDGVLKEGNYSISNGVLDITNGTIIYNEGFMIDSDMMVGITVSDMVDNEPILKMWNDAGDSVSLSHHIYETKHILKLEATNGYKQYIVYSDLFNLNKGQQITVYIKRENNLYDLVIVNKT